MPEGRRDAGWMPELAPFRRDPRFHEFTARLGLQKYWEAKGPPDGYLLEKGRLVERPGSTAKAP